jgi:murein DD-endopeptidase MepM/ murein hydrolase activator NlpD
VEPRGDGPNQLDRFATGSRRLVRIFLQIVAAFGLGWLAWFAAARWWWPKPTPPAAALLPAAPASGERVPASAVEREAPRPLDAAPIAPIAETEPAVPPATPVDGDDLSILRDRRLLLPIAGVEPGDLADDFDDPRSGGRRHEAIDILAPRDTPVLAVDDGRIEKLFESEFGGLTVYQFDREGRFCYYYAHLERYPRGVAEGTAVRRGDTIGYVGTSGNAPPDTPHLHFSIYRLGPDRRWWEGEAINPYLVWSAR